jgi:ATP-dependent DNA helicase RecQ
MVSRVIDAPDRPNISYSVLPVISTAGALSRLVREEKRPILVFSRTRKGAEACARYLIEKIPEEKILFYHAGLDQNERNNVEAWFMGSDSAILTATSAYGMGIDKADIRTIIHVDLPRSIESYLQQSGRGGRDGKPARSILFYSIPDARDLLAGIEGNKEHSILERERCRQIVEYAGGFNFGRGEWPRAEQCRRAKLLSNLGKEEIACSGCDVCSGEAVTVPEGFTEILSLAKRYKRLFTVRELAMILAGRRNSDSLRCGFDRLGGFGILKKWDDIAIEMAISAMVRSGWLTVVERGFRRYRVTPGRGFGTLSGNKARSTPCQ